MQNRVYTPFWRRKNSPWIEQSSYSGCDIIPIVYGMDASTKEPALFALGNIQTLTYSIHRDKGGVRTLGRANPKGFTRGPRCIPSTEKVFIKDRGYISIAEVEEGDLVQSNPDRFDKVMGSFDQGMKMCHSIKLANGYKLRASYDHPIDTERGWVEVCDLKLGDLVKIAGITPTPDKDMDIPDEILIMIAYLLGDGTTLIYPKENDSQEYRIQLSIANTEIDTIGKEVSEILSKYGISYTDYKNREDACINRRICVCKEGLGKTAHQLRKYNILHEWLKKLNIYGKKSFEKSIPSEFIIGLSKRQVVLFLNRLFSTDGCYSISDSSKYIEVSFCSTSEELIDNVRLLLNKLGINAIKSVELKIGKVGGRPDIISKHDCFRLIISESIELYRFCTRVGILSKQYKIEKYLDLILSRINNKVLNIDYSIFMSKLDKIFDKIENYKKAFCDKYNLYTYTKEHGLTPTKAIAVMEELQNNELNVFLRGAIVELIDKIDIFKTVEVLEVNEIGFLPVYDLEVEDKHSFICNFIHVHNTIAGSMIFSVFDRRALWELSKNKMDLKKRVAIADELPGFDIILYFTNEYGSESTLIIKNVNIVDEGQSHSVEDMYIENTMGYIAGDIDLLEPQGIHMSSSAEFVSASRLDYKLKHRSRGPQGIPFNYTYLQK